MTVKLQHERETLRGMTMERHITIDTEWFVIHYDYVRTSGTRCICARRV